MPGTLLLVVWTFHALAVLSEAAHEGIEDSNGVIAMVAREIGAWAKKLTSNTITNSSFLLDNNKSEAAAAGVNARKSTVENSRKLATVAPLNVYLLVKDEFDARRSEIDNFVFQSLNAFSTSQDPGQLFKLNFRG